MRYALFTTFVALGLLLSILLLQELGRQLARRWLAKDPDLLKGSGGMEAAIFGLYGLLIAFTFAGAANRFDQRRQLIVEESNAIGTAYLRVDLLPEAAQPEMRELFRKYLDARLEASKLASVDMDAMRVALDRGAKLQNEIWSRAVAATRGENVSTMLLLPAINQMIDITSTRMMAAQLHPPNVIFLLLFGLALACALLSGYDMGGNRVRNWTHILGFAVVSAISVFVILDMEYPRLGFIRLSEFDRVLVELRQSMK